MTTFLIFKLEPEKRERKMETEKNAQSHKIGQLLRHKNANLWLEKVIQQ